MSTYVAILMICAVFIVGEILSKLVSYKVTGYVFAMIILIIVGGQFGLITTETFNNTLFVDVAYGFGVPFAITCFGGSIPFKSFKGEWKTCIIAIAAVVFIVALGAIAGFTVLDKVTALYGSVEVAGGTQAGLIFLAQLKETGEQKIAAIIAILMTGQVLVGYPACGYALKKAMVKRLGDESFNNFSVAGTGELLLADNSKKLIKVPEFLANNFYYVFAVLALCCIGGFYIGEITGISMFVWDLLIGFIAAQLVGFDNVKINAHYFDDLVNQMQNKQQQFIDRVLKTNYWKKEGGCKMQFDAIVGNPPYMEMDGGAQASARPIYQHFVSTAKSLKPNYLSFIMPTRWYAGGKGLDDFRDEMLDDIHIETLYDCVSPEDIFPNTNIRGGVCYFLWNAKFENNK